MWYWTLGEFLGVVSLLHGRLRDAAVQIIFPVNYWRYAVFRYVEGQLNIGRGARVLDVGSPKLLAIALALRRGAEVWATDLWDPRLDSRYGNYFRYADRLIGTGGAFHTEYQDGRHLTYADDSFDAVFSLSVVEHIPEEGDSEAVREMARVLRPGGRLVIEVPFALEPEEHYRKGSVYDREYKGEPVFYQRIYSPQMLRERIIEPAGLPVREVHVLAALGGVARRLSRLPRALGLALGPWEALLARLTVRPWDEARMEADRRAGRIGKNRREMNVTVVFEKPTPAPGERSEEQGQA